MNYEEKEVTIINGAYGIKTYNTVLKNTKVIYSRILPTTDRQLIIIAVNIHLLCAHFRMRTYDERRRYI